MEDGGGLLEGFFVVVVVASLFGIVAVLSLDVFLMRSLARFACRRKIGNLLEGRGVGGVLRDGIGIVWLCGSCQFGGGVYNFTLKMRQLLFLINRHLPAKLLGDECSGD
jgi:hypothetical protein